MNNILRRCLANAVISSAHHHHHHHGQPVQPSSCINNVNYYSSSARQSKILRKLVAGKDKAKRRWYQDTPSAPPKLQSAASLSNPARQGKNAPRRVHVLNKLFMKHITDLLSTGETADRIVGRGMQISHVKVSADFNYVNVFWSTARGFAAAASSADVAGNTTTSSDELDAILRQVAGHLRHELSQLRLMGEVPRIQFVHDRQAASDAAIDELLARADFGPDYEPAAWAQLRHDLVPGGGGGGCDGDSELPAMRHDVLGLNQGEIMGKIRQTMAKNQQAWRRYEAGETTASTATLGVENPGESVSPGELPPAYAKLAERQAEMAAETRVRDEEFTKFLEQRRYARRAKVVRKNPDFNEPYDRTGYDYDDDDDVMDRFDRQQDYIEEDDNDASTSSR